MENEIVEGGTLSTSYGFSNYSSLALSTIVFYFLTYSKK